MKKYLVYALVACSVALAGCVKDTEIYEKVDKLEERVSDLETAVKNINEVTIPSIRTIVTAIQSSITITDVKPVDGGYQITFSDGNKAVIKNGENGTNGTNGTNGKDGEKGDKGDTPVISVIEEDGVFYWAADGKAIVGADGKKIPVYAVLPQFRINEGKWQVSYDGGQTWADAPVMGEASNAAISIEDGPDSVTFYINGEAYTIQKEKPFCLNFAQRTDIGVKQGESVAVEYTLTGVAEGDEVEVDILNVTAGWEVKVVSLPSGENPGYIKVTNVDNSNGKVFVYAANGKGKTDIKSLCFEEGSLAAVYEAELVASAGGTVTLDVTTNMDYEVWVDPTKTWVKIVDTKAVHTEVITLEVEVNETGAFRSAEVDVIAPNGDTQAFFIVQNPDATATTDITSLDVVADGTTITVNNVTVLATSKNSAIVSDGEVNLYVTGKYLPVGKVINVTGVKGTAGDLITVAVASYETVAETSEVAVSTPLYYGVAIDEAPSYTAVTGTLSKGEEVKVTYSTEDSYGKLDYIFTLEGPTDALTLDEFADGATVTIAGFTTTSEVEYEGSDSVVKCNFVATSVKAVTLKQNTAWTLSYEDTREGNYPDVIVNTVSGTTCNYTFAVVEKADVEEAGSVEAFVADNYLTIADNLQFNLRYYQSYGYTWDELYSIFVMSGSDSDSWNLDYGEYVALAIGVDATANATGDYQYLEFEKVDPAVPANYEDFLGNWTVNGSTYVITAKEEGVSYNVEGIAANVTTDNKVLEGLYDTENKCMTIQEQKIGNRNIAAHGNCSVFFTALYTDMYGSTYPSYPMNTDTPYVACKVVLFDDGTIEFRGGECYDNYDKEWYNVVGYRFRWIIDEGANAGKGNWDGDAVSFPFSGEKQATASEAYLAWLGNYTIETLSIKTGADTTYTVSLTQGLPNETILLNGLGLSVGLPLHYDADKDECYTVFEPYFSNSTYTFYSSGITNDGYIATGTPGEGKISTFKKGADGNVNVASVVYALNEERTSVYALYWGILGKKTTGWVTFSDCDYVVNPCVFKPTTSAPASKTSQGIVAKTFTLDPAFRYPVTDNSVRKSAPAKAERTRKTVGIAGASKLN